MGIDCSACEVNVPVKSGDSRFMTGVCSVTTTSDDEDATDNVGERVVVCPTLTVTFSARYFAKFVASIETLYVPGSSSGALK